MSAARQGWLPRLLVAALGLAAAAEAAAHQPGISYSDVRIEAGRLRYDLTIGNHDLTDIDGDGDGRISPDEVLADYPRFERLLASGLEVAAGGERCPLRLEDFVIDEQGGVRFRLRGPCRDVAPLRVTHRLLALAGREGQNFATIRAQGEVWEHVFTRRDVSFVAEGHRDRLTTAPSFFLLGVEHIATGYDHVLFLLALLVVGGGLRNLVGVVTAFTVAHSVTLALAALDVVTLPSRIVEPVIALSIAWVAAENLWRDRSHGRWRITFGFGLIHGFGFASILRGLDLSTVSLTTSLVAFNLGVEAGQLVIVLATYPLIAWMQRSAWRRPLVVTLSGLTLALALMWFVERVT